MSSFVAARGDRPLSWAGALRDTMMTGSYRAAALNASGHPPKRPITSSSKARVGTWLGHSSKYRNSTRCGMGQAYDDSASGPIDSTGGAQPPS